MTGHASRRPRWCWLGPQGFGILLVGVLVSRLTADDPAGAAWQSRVLRPAQELASPVVTALAAAPGRSLLAAAGDDHRVRLWDLQRDVVLSVLEGHEDWIRALAFAPGGDRLASGGNDGCLLLWRVDVVDQPRKLAQFDSAILQLRFSPDGRMVAAACFDGQVVLLDASSGAVIWQFGCTCTDIRSLAFAPGGHRLAAAGRNGHVHVWELAGGTSLTHHETGRRRIRVLEFLDDQRLLSGGDDGGLCVWRLDADEHRCQRLPPQPGRIFAATVLADGRIAMAGSDNIVRIVTLEQGEVVAELQGHTGTIAAMCRMGSELVTGGYDTTIRVWKQGQNLADGAEDPRVRSARLGQ